MTENQTDLFYILKELKLELKGRLQNGIGSDPCDLERYIDALDLAMSLHKDEVARGLK